MKTKTFDAVAESRKWKEVVAAETAGMTIVQVLAHFSRDAVNHRFQQALIKSKQDGTSQPPSQ